MDRVNNNDMVNSADNILLGMIFVIFIMVVFIRPAYDCVMRTTYNVKQCKTEKFTTGDDIGIDTIVTNNTNIMTFGSDAEHKRNYDTIKIMIVPQAMTRINEVTNKSVTELELNDSLKAKYDEVLTNHVKLGLNDVDAVKDYLKNEFNKIINNKIAELSSDSSTSYLTGGVVEQSNTGNTVLNWMSGGLVVIAVISYILYMLKKLWPIDKRDYALCSSMILGIIIPAIYYKVR